MEFLSLLILRFSNCSFLLKLVKLLLSSEIDNSVQIFFRYLTVPFSKCNCNTALSSKRPNVLSAWQFGSLHQSLVYHRCEDFSCCKVPEWSFQIMMMIISCLFTLHEESRAGKCLSLFPFSALFVVTHIHKLE